MQLEERRCERDDKTDQSRLKKRNSTTEDSRFEEGSDVRVDSEGEGVVALIRRRVGRSGRSKEGEPHRLSLD